MERLRMRLELHHSTRLGRPAGTVLDETSSEDACGADGIAWTRTADPRNPSGLLRGSGHSGARRPPPVE